MKTTLHQIAVATIATVLGTIIALLLWWFIERHYLPTAEPPPSTQIVQQRVRLVP